jgi:hypothetical protein
MTSRTYGTVSADRQKTMSGLEFVQGLADARCRSTLSHSDQRRRRMLRQLVAQG